MPEIDDHTSRLWYLLDFRIQRTRIFASDRHMG